MQRQFSKKRITKKVNFVNKFKAAIGQRNGKKEKQRSNDINRDRDGNREIHTYTKRDRDKVGN